MPSNIEVYNLSSGYNITTLEQRGVVCVVEAQRSARRKRRDFSIEARHGGR